MAQNEINIKVKISDDGSLSLVSQKAEQAAKSTERLTKSRSSYNKGEKGVAGATSSRDRYAEVIKSCQNFTLSLSVRKGCALNYLQLNREFSRVVL